MANSPLATSQGWGVYALQEEGQHNKTHQASAAYPADVYGCVFVREEGNLECFLKQNELVSLVVKANWVIFSQYDIFEGRGQHTAH